MKFGISAFAWTSRFEEAHLGRLSALRAMGIGSIEIPMFAPDALPVESIRRACAEFGLECTVCCILPAHINPLLNDAEEQRKAKQHLSTCIETCAAMGSRLLAGPLYAPIGYLPDHRPTNEEWDAAVGVFQSLDDVLEKFDVMLALEPVNRSETFFLRTAEQAGRFCEAVGNARIGVNIDTFHANIEEQDIARAIGQLGPHLKHIHASENDRGILGRGHVPFAQIIQTLRAMRYNGFLTIEGFAYDPNETASPGRLWADTNVSPEQFATESSAFLHGLLNQAAV